MDIRSKATINRTVFVILVQLRMGKVSERRVSHAGLSFLAQL